MILAALWIFAALPWFDARWTGSVTPAGLAPLVLGQALSMQDKIAESFTGLLGSKLWEQADGVRSVAGVAAFGRYALPMAVCLVAYYVAVLAMSLRSWSRPVEKVLRDVLKPIVGDLPAFYKVTTSLAAGGALAALAILLLTQTRPGPGAVGGAVDVAPRRLRGVRAEANRAPRPLAPAERRGARGAARAQRLQDAGGAARGPVLGRPTTHDHEPLANHSSAVVR